MNGQDADRIGREISLHFRRNNYEACRDLVNAAERRHNEGPGVPEYLTEIGLGLRTTSELEKGGYILITDLDGVDIDGLELPNIGPVTKQAIKVKLVRARRKIIEAQDKKDRMGLVK